MSSSKQIKLGALLSYVAIAVNIITGLIYTPWMVETIGKSQYGLYTLAHSVITLFLFDFGLSSATGRYLSKYNAEGNREAAEGFLGAVYKLYLIIDAVIVVILTVMFFMLDRIYVNLTSQEIQQLKVVYLISGLFSVINFPFVTFNGILSAYEKFAYLRAADLLCRLGNVALTVLALLMGYGLYALVTVHAVVGILTLVLKFLMIRKMTPARAKFRGTPKGIYKDIFGFSVWVTLTSLAARLVFTITPSILGIVAGSAAIAVFGIVSTIEGYTYTVTTAINGMFMPKISRIIASGNAEKDLNRLLISVGRFQFALNGLIVAGFAVVGKAFIDLWMGADYRQAYYGILLVIIPGMFYNALQIANTSMIVTNKVKLTACVSILTGVVNVCLSFPLSAHFGALGACMSIGTAYLDRDLALHLVYHRELPVDIPGFIRKCYLRMSAPLILTILCGSLLNFWIADGGWGRFLLKASLTAAVYAVLTVVVGLTGQERRKIMDYLPKRRNA